MSDNRREALEALRDDINAGKPFTVGMCMGAFPKGYSLAYKADRGSIDAAKELHDAVLPGWHFNVATEANRQGFYATVSPKQWGKSFVACSETPARAWLLSILSALISETPKGETP